MCPAAGAEAALPFEVATADQGDPRSPVKRFLTPLGLNQHRDTMKHLGFDTPDDFGDMTPGDAADMKAALLEEKIPLGHVMKIMRRATQRRGSVVAQQVQPAFEEVSANVDAVVETSRYSLVRALGPTLGPSASAEQSALIQTSADQATVRRETEHKDKVCHTPATRRRPHRRRRHRSFLAPSTLKPAYPLHI